MKCGRKSVRLRRLAARAMGIVVLTVFNIAALAGIIVVARFILSWTEGAGKQVPPPKDDG